MDDLRSAAAGLTMLLTVKPPQTARSVFDLVWSRTKDRKDARELMRFCGWLVRSGVKDADGVVELLDEYMRLKPKNPYAYFAPGGAAREGVLLRVRAGEAQRERERTDHWLKGGVR